LSKRAGETGDAHCNAALSLLAQQVLRAART
jgi:hypothetical protein